MNTRACAVLSLWIDCRVIGIGAVVRGSAAGSHPSAAAAVAAPWFRQQERSTASTAELFTTTPNSSTRKQLKYEKTLDLELEAAARKGHRECKHSQAPFQWWCGAAVAESPAIEK
jgi:hypothetical protein